MKRFKKILLIGLLTLLMNISIFSQPWSEKMANSIMAYSPTRYSSSWNYVSGTVLRSFIDLYEKTGNSAYYDYIKNTVDYVVNSSGIITSYKLTDYNIDQVKEGSIVLYLYNKTGQIKYKIAADTLKKQLLGHPRTSDGGFWHKKVYPYQMWQDGLYMGEPFYAQYSVMFNSSNDFDDIAKQFILMEKHARDATTGLIYHGWDEQKVQLWADPVTGCSKSFWGRAMGWYMMALVDVLDFMPVGHSKRDSLIQILQREAEALSHCQDATTGCWYQVLDQGSRTGNYLESSATCQFTYSYLKAVRLGYIDSKFLDVAKKGYQGILDNFIVENSGKYDMKQTCCSAGLGRPDTRNGTFEYYISESICTNDGKALGPFILASLEMERLPVAINSKNESKGLNLKIVTDPVTHQSTIKYSLQKPSKIKITVFNCNGKEIFKMDYLSQSAGRHAIPFNSNFITSGLYVVKIQADNILESGKFIII